MLNSDWGEGASVEHMGLPPPELQRRRHFQPRAWVFGADPWPYVYGYSLLGRLVQPAIAAIVSHLLAMYI